MFHRFVLHTRILPRQAQDKKREVTKPLNFTGGDHRLDREKAIREQYDAASARMILLHLVEELGVLTGDDRFSAALDCLRKPADYYL